MAENKPLTQPKDLDEAVKWLIELIESKIENKLFVEANSENDWVGKTHHGLGMTLRNGWYLWWSPVLAKKAKEDDPETDFPQEIPSIVAWFHDKGIYHADDMSGIIFTTAYRRYKKQPEELEKQYKTYINFWKKQKIDVKRDWEAQV